ncbi:MAG: LLM class flavin-dependent oxidoreductase [Chloroflexi bacterium CFX7]|nr:LLM class flavin-dependent oxidoreductase [Chloroflexi bacterium CFX7]RIL03709.1 MAG: LLM class flavin-dependent oxidoreductase [bacterium]
MTRKLAIMITWQFDMKREDAIALAKIADECGVDSFWVPEGWARDAFSLLISIAEKTERIKLATGIVNVYSRTPGALAQHFATLDEWSGGRAIIGLGASSANVIEQFHGVPFQPSLARIRETVEIINTLMRGEKLVHSGKWFNMDRGFTLRFTPPRPHIPIFIAALNPKSVKQTAQIADGWMPVMIPLSGLKQEIGQFRAWVAEAGRDPSQVMVKSPGGVTVSDNPGARDAGRGFLAFYIARMGTFYYNQLARFGFGDEAAAVKMAFDQQGSAAGAAALSPELLDQLGFAGNAQACLRRIQEEEAAGVNIHSITIDTRDPVEFGRAVETLLR